MKHINLDMDLTDYFKQSLPARLYLGYASIFNAASDGTEWNDDPWFVTEEAYESYEEELEEGPGELGDVFEVDGQEAEAQAEEWLQDGDEEEGPDEAEGPDGSADGKGPEGF